LAADEVIEELANGKPEFLDYRLRQWAKRSPRFAEFLEHNRSKLRGKLEGLTDPEGIRDVLYELEIGYLFLLDGRSDVQYEKLRNEDGKGPDYTATRSAEETFNIEVKRIREADKGFRFDRVIERLHGHFASIPSPFHVSVDYVAANIATDFVDRIDDRYSEICNSISVNLNRLLEGSLNVPLKVPLPGFEEELQVHFGQRGALRRTDGTTVGCGIKACFYTGEEWEKFLRIMNDTLSQLIPRMMNIIVINTDSSTHNKYHLEWAIRELRESLKHIDNLKKRSAWLGGVVFHNHWIGGDEHRNFVWKNPEATHGISFCLNRFLLQMSEETNPRQKSWINKLCDWFADAVSCLRKVLRKIDDLRYFSS
jgi:hypothetical protein